MLGNLLEVEIAVWFYAVFLADDPAKAIRKFNLIQEKFITASVLINKLTH